VGGSPRDQQEERTDREAEMPHTLDHAAVGAALRRIRQAKRLTLEAVTDVCGVDTGNLSRIERGDLGWSLPTIANIAKAMKVDLSEIIAEAERERGGRRGASMSVVMSVPVINIDELSEGKLQPAIRKSKDTTTVTVDVSTNAFAFRIRGNSMSPDFKPGELIVVDPDLTPAFGNYVLVAVDDGVVFRCMEVEGNKTYLHAVDKRFPAIPLKRTHKIIGVARQAIRELM
jgi:SOS-response transcriptional repressor LexA